MKNESIKVRLPKAEKDSLVAVAKQLDIPASQIVREGIRERLSELKQTQTEQPETIALDK